MQDTIELYNELKINENAKQEYITNKSYKSLDTMHDFASKLIADNDKLMYMYDNKTQINTTLKLDFKGSHNKKDLQAFKVLKSCTRDEISRFQMTGLYYCHEKKQIVATDTTKLFIYDFELPIIFDKKIFSIDIVKTNVYLTCDVDGIFPSYEKAIPTIEHTIKMEDMYLKNNELMISNIMTKAYKNGHHFNIDGSQTKEFFKLLKLSSNFNCHYMNEKRPVVIKNDEFLFLIMPILSRD